MSETPTPTTPSLPIIRSRTLQILAQDGSVVIRLDEYSSLIMEPAAALGIAGFIIRKALEAAPGRFIGDERAILARILAEVREITAAMTPPAPQVG
jgi:hypothetical protein